MKLPFAFLARFLIAIVALAGLLFLLDCLFPRTIWVAPDFEGMVFSNSIPIVVVVSRDDSKVQRLSTDTQGRFHVGARRGTYSRWWNFLGGDTVKQCKVAFETDSRTIGEIDLGIGGSDLISDSACLVLIRVEMDDASPVSIRLNEKYLSERYRNTFSAEVLQQIKEDFFVKSDSATLVED